MTTTLNLFLVNGARVSRVAGNSSSLSPNVLLTKQSISYAAEVQVNPGAVLRDSPHTQGACPRAAPRSPREKQLRYQSTPGPSKCTQFPQQRHSKPTPPSVNARSFRVIRKLRHIRVMQYAVVVAVSAVLSILGVPGVAGAGAGAGAVAVAVAVAAIETYYAVPANPPESA